MVSNGDLMGTQRLKKVPMGTWVPKWGPIWEQCNAAWSGHIVAPLWIPHLPIVGKKLTQGPLGPEKGQKGPFGALDGKTRMYNCEATEIAAARRAVFRPPGRILDQNEPNFHNQNWSAPSKNSQWKWPRSAYSRLVLLRNDQKKYSGDGFFRDQYRCVVEGGEAPLLQSDEFCCF